MVKLVVLFCIQLEMKITATNVNMQSYQYSNPHD